MPMNIRADQYTRIDDPLLKPALSGTYRTRFDVHLEKPGIGGEQTIVG